jgi:hypothetical protein
MSIAPTVSYIECDFVDPDETLAEYRKRTAVASPVSFVRRARRRLSPAF